MSPKVEKGISYCPYNDLFLLRTKEDKGYFRDVFRLVRDADKAYFWDNWNEGRDKQAEGSSLVVPLQLLRWTDD